jgi:hypothetical protein
VNWSRALKRRRKAKLKTKSTKGKNNIQKENNRLHRRRLKASFLKGYRCEKKERSERLFRTSSRKSSIKPKGLDVPLFDIASPFMNAFLIDPQTDNATNCEEI